MVERRTRLQKNREGNPRIFISRTDTIRCLNYFLEIVVQSEHLPGEKADTRKRNIFGSYI